MNTTKKKLDKNNICLIKYFVASEHSRSTSRSSISRGLDTIESDSVNSSMDLKLIPPIEKNTRKKYVFRNSFIFYSIYSGDILFTLMCFPPFKIVI